MSKQQTANLDWRPYAEQTFARPDRRTYECLTCGQLDFSLDSHLSHAAEHGDNVLRLGRWGVAA